MYLYLLLITLTIVNAEVEPDFKCDGVIIDGHYYEKEILKTGLRAPSDLAVDYNTNILYFSHYTNGPNYLTALLDLNTKELKDINDVPKGYSTTVDQNTHEVYIGGTDGIYKYDLKRHKSELYAANDKNIWWVFFKNVLYFSESVSAIIYTYIDGDIARFKDMEEPQVRLFVIDSEDVMFYSDSTGLYAKRKSGKNVYSYSNEFIEGLTLDVHGHAYMCTKHAIYKIDKTRMSLEKLLDANNCLGLAFDSTNNIIYSDNNNLVRFKKIKKTCKISSC